MILYIDDLQIPNTLSGNAEKFNADNQRRTVSGRLITKKSSYEKWRATLNYEGRTTDILQPGLRAALYEKCRQMRGAALPVTFVSPYDNAQYTVMMKCTKPMPPKLLHIRPGLTGYYSNCGAVFEEV